MQSLKQFIADESGFTGAEKALLTMLALGTIIVVAKTVLSGSSAASNAVESKMSGQAMPANPTFQ